jgi:hypothetical protein
MPENIPADATNMQQPCEQKRQPSDQLPHRARRTRKGRARLLTLDSLDGRTAAAHAVRQNIDTLTSDLGGDDQLSEGQRQLVQRAAVCGAIIADFEARWVAGEPIPLNEYLAAVNVQRRVLATLGLERRSRDVTPSLDDIKREYALKNAAAAQCRRKRAATPQPERCRSDHRGMSNPGA